MVLWMAALLALAAAALASSAQVHVRTSRNSVELLRAQVLADTGIRLALLDLMTGDSIPDAARFKAGDGAFACRLPEGDRIDIEIRDEAGKIDLNTASDDLLRALMTGAGIAPQEAAKLVDAIADFRDADGDRRLNGAETGDYAAAGRPFGPKNAPFDAIAEAGSILGVTAGLFERIAPHLTVHSGQDGIDPRHANADLLDILSRSTPLNAGGALQSPSGTVLTGDKSIPSRFVTASTGETLAIRAEATTTAGFRSARQAIVARLEGALRPSSRPAAAGVGRADNAQVVTPPLTPYRILQWDLASDRPARQSAPASGPQLPPC